MTGPVPPRSVHRGELHTPDGVRLHTLTWPADAPRSLVLLVHGLGDHSGRYEELARWLADRGHPVHAYDQRGHGRSGGRRGDASSFDQLVADLNQVVGSIVEAATPGGRERPLPLFLVGHSMGGLLVLRYVQTRIAPSLEGAALLAPWLATSRPVPGWKRLLGRALGRVAPGLPLPTGMDPGVLTRDPERREARARDEHAHSWISPRLFESVEAAQEAALATPTGTDVLFVVPGDDRLVDARVTSEYASRQDRGATTVLNVPGACHEAWNDLPREDVFRGVAGWIEGRVGERGEAGG